MPTITTNAIDISNRLKGQGLRMTAKPDSLIAAACGELHKVIPDERDISIEDIVEAVEKETTELDANPFLLESDAEPEDKVNIYKHAIDNVIEPILPLAQGIISRVKDIIIPATNSIFDAAYEKVSATIDGGGIKLTIVTDGSENPIWHQAVAILNMEEDSDWGSKDYVLLKGLSFPEKTGQEVLADLHSLSPELNPLIDELVAGDTSKLERFYNRVFNRENGELYTCKRTNALFAAMLAVVYAEEIPDGVTGGNLEAYGKTMREMRAANCLALRSEIEGSELLTKAGRLVLSFPEDGAEYKPNAVIVVNGLLYERWLESGGTVDAIYGAYASSAKTRNATDILEDLAGYERQWIRRVGLAQSTMKDRFETLFARHLAEEIQQYGEDNKLKVNRSAVEMIFKRTSSIDVDNAYSFARRAICRCLFDEGDALAILENIDALSVSVKGIELEDAIDIVMIDWLVNWALEQVKVSKL